MEYKQAIVMRKDLDLSKGKLAAQAAHASLEAYKCAKAGARAAWESAGQKKVVLKVDGLKELEAIFRQAKEAGLPCSMIKDAGKTELPAGTATAVGIGPATEREIDSVTRNLKLL